MMPIAPRFGAIPPADFLFLCAQSDGKMGNRTKMPLHRHRSVPTIREKRVGNEKRLRRPEGEG